MPKITFLLFMIVNGLVLVSGCESEPPHPAAPLGDVATLEKLAAAYETVSKNIPVNPVKMQPEARRKFLEQVFDEAGYDYSRTLLALADVPKLNITQHHRDMKELLFLPHYGTRLEDVEDLYTKKEIRAIRQIDERFK